MDTARTAELTLASRASAYITLTKPDVSLLVLMTTAAGYYMGARGGPAHASDGRAPSAERHPAAARGSGFRSAAGVWRRRVLVDGGGMARGAAGSGDLHELSARVHAAEAQDHLGDLRWRIPGRGSAHDWLGCRGGKT